MDNPSRGSLADKIAGILNTAPNSFDPEDDAVDATNAQIVSHKSVEDKNEEEEILSKFRRANIDLLADVDNKYAGKKAIRKSLNESDSEDISSDNIESSGDDEESNSAIRRTDHLSDDLEVGDDESDVVSKEESEDDDNEESDDDDEEEDESSEFDDVSISNLEEHDGTNFKHINDTNVSSQIKKGVCVRNQMAAWENLLEIRIQLQKCLIVGNKMPQSTVFEQIKKESGPEFSNKVNETKIKLGDTLDKLMQLQSLLLKQFPETKNLSKKEATSAKCEDPEDEEIPSDTDVEESENEVDGTAEKEAPPSKKKKKLEDYEREISDQHNKYKDYRNSVIQKWNDKTRVVLKGGATSHSVLDQIEYNLSNKEKLVKRTQLKRSHYSIVGEDGNDNDKGEEECNSEIFDDDDFYHQLLRELIEVKSADVTDPVQLGQQWIQLQNLRSKMKRKIDTRATKGRKIRYAVHSKLVNFMGPIDENLWTEEAKNELYNSLFGKNQPVFNVQNN
jgi:protein AATF/BFR2